MFKKLTAYTLIFLFAVLFSYETIEFLCGKTFEHQITASGILELEEEGGSSEESKEEKDEEIKFEDNLLSANINYQFHSTLERQIFACYLLFEASDYSSQIFSPPETV